MKSWVGRLFATGTPQQSFLRCYAQAFGSVEGNTTFYALPKPETVARWRAQVPDTFRFCFKFPRTVSHEGRLAVNDDARRFLRLMEPLADRLGCLMLQLPPHFGSDRSSELERFLDELPRDYRYAVEVRHDDWFVGPGERTLEQILGTRGIDRVVMDARGLHASSDERFADVRGRKPQVPIVLRATGDNPIVRFVPHEDFSSGEVFLRPWLEQLPRWIAEGRRPFFFMHAPDDTFAPENAYRFHQLLSQRVELAPLPRMPLGGQLSLFG